MIIRHLSKFIVVMILFFPIFSSSEQQGPVTVSLRIVNNGHKAKLPNQMVLSTGDHSSRIAVLGGYFEVPSQFLTAKQIKLEMSIGGNHIHISHIRGMDFRKESWTLLLADRVYGEDYQSIVPKGADVRSSCIVVFDSIHTDPGVVLFEKNCRSK